MLHGRKILFTFLALILSATAATVRAEVIDRVVADVNGEIITLYDLNQRLRPVIPRADQAAMSPAERQALLEISKKILDRMILEMLISQECARLKITVSDTELQNSIKMFKDQNQLTEEKLLEQLRLEGMTRQDFEGKMRDDMLRSQLIGYMVRHKVLVTKDEIRAHFEKNKARYVRDRMVHIGIILLPEGADADGLRSSIESGKVSFTDAARAHSIGPNAAAGGDIGRFSWRDIAPAWREALKDLKPGQVSQPFMVENNIAMLEILTQEEGGASELTPEIEAEIYKSIYEPRLDARFTEYMEQLKSKAVINIRL